MGQQWSAVRSGTLTATVLEATTAAWYKSFWRRFPLPYPYHSLTLGQTTWKKHNSDHQQKTRLRIY